MSKSPIAPGANILVRDAAWRVRRVDRTSSGSLAIDVIGISEIVRDKEAIFLEEYEPRIEVLDPATTELVRDASSNFQASLLFIESQLRGIGPTDDGLYVGHEAAMDLLDYQLEPAAQALSQPRQRILIADAVGLGKTLEAGILLSELMARGKAKRILVVTVKSMLTQFQKELWSRFTIPLVRLDSVGLQRIRSRIPTNQNPFYFYDKTIVSVDTLKQNNEYRTYLENAYWDVIVIDEAHNVAARGKNKSQRARLAELLSHRSDTLIMLSATPHDGKARSFASLMNMLDPTAIADEDHYSPEDIDGLFIRRFKKDIAHQVKDHFPDREISQVKARATVSEEQAFDTFAEMKFTALDQHRGGHMLFKTTLEKALLSSPAACIVTIDHRIKRLETRVDPLPYADDIAALEALRADLVGIKPANYGKYQRLVELLGDAKSPFRFSGRAKDDRMVIFTERIETMNWLARRLTEDLGLDSSKVEVLHGSMSDIDQQRVVEDFGKEKADVRLLIASDVASEGINLHYYCNRMVHFDIPWSLLVFQQRNGRIDRYGQAKTPHIAYLYTESANAKIRGDVRILELLIEKDEQASKNIGDPSALMGVYDVEEEEAITAAAIESEQGPAALEARLQDMDLFSQLLATADQSDKHVRPRKAHLPSLYKSDFDYLRHALDVLRADSKLVFEVDSNRRRISLQLTDSLRRRFEKLPDEILPEDGRIILSADPDAMQAAIAEARAEASAEDTSWPVLHYLWRLNPVLQWANDRVAAVFGRHNAPVVVIDRGFEPDERVFILSGLIPNRKSQPLLHRWLSVVFRGDTLTHVETFDALRERIELGQRTIPNRHDALDTASLQALLPAAVKAATARILELRADFENHINPRLNDELAKLEVLRTRQQRFAQLTFEADAKRDDFDRRNREITKLFDEYYGWVEDTMTTEKAPFIQVIAALVAAA
ncbi:MAG: DEAD/DEAH box helicase [Bradymonadaceae bacterium]|nr:DEAD/DEAH box helicase [Lujinxingiaceae bacterium]